MAKVRAPGRVNLIGDHTDYSGGFVMPVAIQLATTVTLAANSDGKLFVHSEGMAERVCLDLARPLHPRGHWSDYVAGVASQLIAAGYNVVGGDMIISSDVPRGAGLSSSAALEVATGLALVSTAGESIDRLELAQLCQRAENEFVGAKCGIMDQYVACFGEECTALLIDCRSLTSVTLPLPPDISIVVMDTMVKHAVAAGEYNKRREECEQATATLAIGLPHVRTLRDLTPYDVVQAAGKLPSKLLQRARHVVGENERVVQAREALERGDFKRVGELMAESHRSLRDDYEVSCPELDLMVELAALEPGAIGTRMTGGGFGGCTVSLVYESAAHRFLASMQERYEEATGMHPHGWICTAASSAVALDETP